MAEPSSRSPGYLVFRYQSGGVVHHIGFALLVGVNPNSDTDMQSAADELGPLVAANLTNTGAMLDWYTTDRNHHQLISGTFSDALPGGLVDSAPGWKSLTWTLTGIESGSDGSYRNGKTRCILFISGTRQPVAGQKVVTVTTDTPLHNLATALESSSVYWAGKFGLKANVHGLAPIQFNSAAQKRYGA